MMASDGKAVAYPSPGITNPRDPQIVGGSRCPKGHPGDDNHPVTGLGEITVTGRFASLDHHVGDAGDFRGLHTMGPSQQG